MGFDIGNWLNSLFQPAASVTPTTGYTQPYQSAVSPINTRVQGGTTPSGLQLGAQQRPAAANYPTVTSAPTMYGSPTTTGISATGTPAASSGAGTFRGADGKLYGTAAERDAADSAYALKLLGGEGGTTADDEYKKAQIQNMLWNQDPTKVGSEAWQADMLNQYRKTQGTTDNTAYQQQQLTQTYAQYQAENALKQQQMAQDAAQQQAQLEFNRQKQAQDLAWAQQQQQASLDAEKAQRLATLSANPQSWLEAASLSGNAPVIQPWMVPLMPQDYGLSSGAAIPNWSATDMSNMPDITTPSAQYMARIAPSSQEQLYGYEKAKTGASPADTQWRIWSRAPTGGKNTGLNY